MEPTIQRQKVKKLTLSQYVKRRNGVPLGGSGALSKMLYRSLGAGSFDKFWHYWNPIFGYYLGKYSYAPLRAYIPAPLALIITFIFCGAIHDAVTMLVSGRPAFLFTPWFCVMGTVLVLAKALNINYARFSWATRALINISYVGLSLALVLAGKQWLIAAPKILF